MTITKDFDEELWYITVDCMTVFADGRLVVRFRDGFDVETSKEI